MPGIFQRSSYLHIYLFDSFLIDHEHTQDRLYQEIQEICGPEKITEEHLSLMPYLNAVFHETLRYHTPVPLIPPRITHEDTQLGGYDIPSGTEVSTLARTNFFHQ